VARTDQDIAKGLQAKKPKPGAPYHLSAYRGDIVRIQKNPRSHKASFAESLTVCGFANAARYSKIPAPSQFNAANELVPDTGWYWRDAIHAGMFGKLYAGERGLKITTPTVFLQGPTPNALASGVAEALTQELTKWDNNYFWDPTIHQTRMTFRAPGLYLVGAQVHYNAVSGSYRTTFLRLNGTTTIATSRQNVPSANSAYGQPFVLWYFESGDYLELMAQSNVAGVSADTEAWWAMAMSPEQVIPE